MKNINKMARKNILDISPYKPGKPIEEVARELGLKKIIKLASNESPLGPSPEARKAIRSSIKDLSLYPDGSTRMLREAIAETWGIDSGKVLVGNGSNEIIELVLRTFLNEGEEVITSKSSFLVYPLATQVCNGKIIQVPMNYYTYDLDAIAKAVTSKTKIIFIANPNNPTGTMVGEKEVESFIKKIPEHVIIVFDEAYGELADPKRFPNSLKYIKHGKNVVMLRTFSKIYGLAGLRVGYGIASEDMIGLMNKVRQPFNVNSVAQIAARAALKDDTYRHKMISLVGEGRQYFYKEFYKMGLFYVPSEANFVLVNVGDGKRVFNELLKKGVIVREMAEYEFPEFVRVTIGTMAQNKIFIRALKEVLHK